ncbi:MAG: TetR family transcriptional regulator [Magnetococcales bacterium]|nr:TetR family transcriptional regulator [Magnetococcales bacterium]
MFAISREIFFMRRTKAEAEQTREDILNAAIDMFYKDGVSKTTLNGIASHAGVTRGAIYWHFKNKMEIFDGLHEKLHKPLSDHIMADMKIDHPHPIQQLKELCVKLLVEFEENEQKRKILTIFLRKCEYSGELEECKARYCDEKKESLGLFTKYFEKAQEQDAISKEADPELLCQAVNCYMKGIIMEYLDYNDTFDMRAKAPALMDLLFKSIGK